MVDIMSKSFEIRQLSQEFYNKFDINHFPEILGKSDRPYMALITKIDGNTFAIPFRTNITHKASYRFYNSSRPTKHITGLDFSKVVIVNDSKYLGAKAIINNLEYEELSKKSYFIIQKFTNYLNGYKRYVSGGLNEFEARKYQYTTLKYYHKELGLDFAMAMSGTSQNVTVESGGANAAEHTVKQHEELPDIYDLSTQTAQSQKQPNVAEPCEKDTDKSLDTQDDDQTTDNTAPTSVFNKASVSTDKKRLSLDEHLASVRANRAANSPQSQEQMLPVNPRDDER